MTEDFDIPEDPDAFLQWLHDEFQYKQVMYFVARKGATWIGEISDLLNLDYKKAKRMVHQLTDAGHLKRLRPHMDNPDPRLLWRRPELWDMGATGIERWAMYSFVGLADHFALKLRSGDRVLPNNMRLPDSDAY